MFYTVRGLVPLALLLPPDTGLLKDEDRRLPSEVPDARERKPAQHNEDAKIKVSSMEGRIELELDNVRPAGR